MRSSACHQAGKKRSNCREAAREAQSEPLVDPEMWGTMKSRGKDALVAMSEWGMSPRMVGGGVLLTMSDLGLISDVDVIALPRFNQARPLAWEPVSDVLLALGSGPVGCAPALAPSDWSVMICICAVCTHVIALAAQSALQRPNTCAATHRAPACGHGGR